MFCEEKNYKDYKSKICCPGTAPIDLKNEYLDYIKSFVNIDNKEFIENNIEKFVKSQKRQEIVIFKEKYMSLLDELTFRHEIYVKYKNDKEVSEVINVGKSLAEEDFELIKELSLFYNQTVLIDFNRYIEPNPEYRHNTKKLKDISLKYSLFGYYH